MYRLPVLEVLLSPLLQERAHALVLVLGAAGNAEGLGLESGACVDVGLHAHADAALDSHTAIWALAQIALASSMALSISSSAG